MDIKLENLIEKIKTEGVEEAKKSSEGIIEKARQDASSILKKAQKEADDIIEEANKNADKIKANAESALRQAERDTVLVTKEKITKLFDRVFKKEVGDTLSPTFLRDLIVKMMGNWKDDSKLEFLVSEKDLDKLKDLVLSKTRESLKNSVTFKIDRGISKGFRVGSKGENVYYDFTDQNISEFLREFLNPSIKEILDRENG